MQAKTQQYRGKWTNENLEQVVKVLQNRLAQEDTDGATVVSQPPDTVVVQLPKTSNRELVIKSLVTTASLQFYLLPELGNRDGTAPAIWEIRTSEDKNGNKTEILVDKSTGKDITPEELDTRLFQNPDRPPVATNGDLTPNNRAEINPATHQPEILFELNDKGAQRFEEVTRANVGKYLAIFLDKKLLTAPIINSPIPGKGVIEGSFTLESAKRLANLLNAGALPVPLQIKEQTVIH